MGEYLQPPQVEALFKAVSEGDSGTLKHLISQTVDLSSTGEEGMMPLHIAAKNGHETIARILVDAHARIDSRCNFGRTPLMLAISNRHFELAKFLINRGADTNAHSNTGYTVLMYAATNSTPEIVNMILPHVDNLNKKNSEGRTALMTAVKFNNIELASLLISRGALIDIKDNSGKNSVDYAESERMQKLLLEKMVTQINRHDQTKFERFVSEFREKVIETYGSVIAISAFIILAGLIFLSLKTYLRPDYKEPSLEAKAVAADFSRSYCGRLSECLSKNDMYFMRNCIQQADSKTLLFLSGKKKCVDIQANNCKHCISQISCSQINNTDLENIDDTCDSCSKACK